MTDPDFASGVALVDGTFVPVAEARIPLLDWGFLRSDACQDTISAWNGLFFRLDDHLARFERSFKALRMECPLGPEERRQAVFDAVRLTGFRNAYVQIIMTRGSPPIGSRDVRLCRNRFYLFCVPYIWIATPEVQERGLHLHISDIVRVPATSVDPRIKHYHWLDFQQGLLEAYDHGAETVVVDDGTGHLAEGPGFNVFVARDGRIATPDAACLDGMTRDTVFRLCEATNLACEARPVSREEAANAEEVFLTSTAGGILPVTRIDGAPVADGRPGPITLRLKELYWKRREDGWLGTPAVYDDGGDQNPSSSG